MMAREFYLKNQNPIGSRPSDLIGLCRRHTKPDPQHTRKGREDKGIQGTPTDDDDDVYYYIRLRLMLEGETENKGLCTKERKGVTAVVLMATPALIHWEVKDDDDDDERDVGLY